VPAGLIFSSAAFFARPLEQTFRLAAETGFSGVEVMVTKDPASQDGAAMRKLADRYDMSIGAIHAPCLLLTRRVWGTDPVGKVERSIEVAREAGAGLVVVHPPYRWQISYQRWLTDKLPELSTSGDVVVAVENMFPLWIGERGVTLHANQDIEDLNEMPDIVLDTSHAAVAGHDLVRTRRLFDERIRHVHLSDNAGRGWDSHLPPGEGILDIDGFLEDLVTGGYDGDVSLEVDLRRYLTDDEKLRDVMVSMRARCQKRMAAAAATEG
jgi:sugar phosphate isomerase/epimerase